MFEQFSAMQMLLALAFGLSAAVYLALPGFIRFMKKKGVCGIDVHKLDRPKVAESGGIILLVASSLLLLAAYFLLGDLRIAYVALLATSFSIYGLVDDMFRLGKYRKLLISLPIAFAGAWLSGLTGAYFVLALLFLVAATNIFNIFAGLNGLEMGSSAIVAAFLSVAALAMGLQTPSMLSASMFLILLAFLAYNRYPARIFPGDVGTMLMGGFFSSLALLYGLWYVLVPLLSLHILDCLLKGCSAGYFSSHEKKPTRVLRNGILQPRDDFLSVIRLALRIRPMTERRTVSVLWLIEVVIGMATLMVMV
ncbi:MAG: hypothetical protein QXU82_01745 [Candidatus Aenigmatarchaeota archaeon]